MNLRRSQRSKGASGCELISSDSKQVSEKHHESSYEKHASENETGRLALDKARDDGNGYQSSGQIQPVVEVSEGSRMSGTVPYCGQMISAVLGEQLDEQRSQN